MFCALCNRGLYPLYITHTTFLLSWVLGGCIESGSSRDLPYACEQLCEPNDKTETNEGTM